MRRINLNRCGRDELVALPLIGVKRAGRIVEFRARNGWFRSVDDLALVPGIGETIVERVRPLVTV